MSADITEADYLALVAAIRQASPEPLSPLAAGILAAGHLGIAGDSRSFARIFGIAHALVLRALTELSGQHGLVDIIARDQRTQRQTFALSDRSAAYFAHLLQLSHSIDRPASIMSRNGGSEVARQAETDDVLASPAIDSVAAGKAEIPLPVDPAAAPYHMFCA